MPAWHKAAAFIYGWREGVRKLSGQRREERVSMVSVPMG